jgi:DnaJ family protein A protein 2
MGEPHKETDLYKVLGLERGADKEECRRAYLKLSRKYHPDKGGSEEDFKAISRAHEVLTDDQKRQYYEMTGQVEGEGGSGGGGGGGGGPFGFGGGGPGGFPFDIGSLFGMFGGGGPMGGMPTGPRVRRAKAPSKVHELPLRLADFYSGRTIQMKFERQKFCDGCKGVGAKSFVSCGACQGRGFVEQVVMMGPGMQALTRGPCQPCMGEGKKPGAACGSCNGKKFQSQEKVLDIKIEPGMKVGEVLVFARECSDNHDYMEAGDVHIILQEADEEGVPRRDGDVLHVNFEISLSECLLGCERKVDGHPGYPEGLDVQIKPGFMSGEVLVVEGKGMACRGGGFGNLVCHIGVKVTDQEREKLSSQSIMLKAIFSTV